MLSSFLLHFLQHLPLLILLLLLLNHHAGEGVADANNSVDSGMALITMMEVDERKYILLFSFIFFTASSSPNSCSSSPPSN